MILLSRISSDVILVLLQLPLIRNGNYHFWWGAHVYLSIQTDLFSHPFEVLTDSCLKSEQCVSCLLFRQAAHLVQDRPSFSLENRWFQTASLSSCFTPLWCPVAVSPCQLALHLFPTTLQPAASFLAWKNYEQCCTRAQSSLKGTPGSTIFRGLPNSFEPNSHLWKQAKHLIQISVWQGFHCWFLPKIN